MRVYLTGFMGAGKTTAGKKLARRLGYKFIDLDEYIQTRENRSIPEIFENSGEAHFRKIESDCLREASEEDNVVVSTGGGTPCYYDNMAFMNETGMSIYLQLAPSSLFRRLKEAQGNRPLVKNKSPKELLLFIEDRLSQREPYYLKASHTINANNLKIPELVKMVKETESS